MSEAVDREAYIKELEELLRHIHDVTDDDGHRMMIEELLSAAVEDS